MTRNKLSELLVIVGFLLIAAAMVMPLIYGPQNNASQILMTLGALVLFVGRVIFTYDGKNFRVKRLYALQRWSPIIFGVAAYFMWTSLDPRDWLVFVLAGAVIQVYVSLMLPRALAKAKATDTRA